MKEGSFPGKENLKRTTEQEKIHELEKKFKNANSEQDKLKKSNESFPHERSIIYSLLKNDEQTLPMEKMFGVLQVCRGSYYR